MDINTLSVPLFEVISIVGSSSILIAWIYNTFENKSDVKEKINAHDLKLATQDALIQNIARDVSFIRGTLERKS